jgi:RNA polymerase sigma-70 factor (ECF subfamily)
MHTRPLESRWNIQEPDLIAGAIRKEDGAVRELIRRYNQRLYRLARSIVKDDDEAEEVLQEAYLRAFSQISAFRGDSTLGTWLGRIVLNEALGRRRRHRPSVELTDASQVIPFPNGNP